MGRTFVSRVRYRRIVGAMLASATVMVLGAETASAAGTGNFTCRASVLRAELPLGATLLEPVASNRPNDPCVSDKDSLLTLNATVLSIVGLNAKALASETALTPTGATSTATAADVQVIQLLGNNIRVKVAESKASVSCVDGSPAFSGSSRVVGLTVNGRTIAVTGQPNQVVLGGLLVLNQRIESPDRIITRAVVVNLVGLVRVVVSESIADVNGNPCFVAPPPPLPECSDGKDNDNDGNIDFRQDGTGDVHCESAQDNMEFPVDL